MSPERATLLPLAEHLSTHLRTRRLGRPLRAYEVLPSTNTAAMHWAYDDAPHGSLVLAEQQTAGRGRQGRTWHAAAGQNLLFSLVLRPGLPPTHLNLITLAAGVAVAETIASLTAPFLPQIKWPNDILLDGQKCCGMLLESSLASGRDAVVVLGIGLNVNQRDFPDELDATATSLCLHTGRPLQRAPLLASLLTHLEDRLDHLADGQGAALRQAYTKRLVGLGDPITLRFAGHTNTVTGRLLGINEQGALRLETADGIQLFHAGEVTTHAR